MSKNKKSNKAVCKGDKYIEKFQNSPDSTIKYFGCGKANKISHHYSEDSKKKHKGYKLDLLEHQAKMNKFLKLRDSKIKNK